MKTVLVPLQERTYKIVIGDSHLAQCGNYLKKLNIGQDALIVTHPFIRKRYGKKVVAAFSKNRLNVKWFEVPEGEKSKSMRVASQVIEKIARYDAMKKVFVIALGGGVIGDLAGYIAAVYKRGVPYVQIPTTFLAQIDSAIGGKVAIDLPIGKNLVGAFYQPKLVYSDVSVLSTLSVRQLRNGLAEAIKYGIIADRTLFDYIDRNHDSFLKADPKVLTHVVCSCSRIKAQVVSKDEREKKGIRTILNFGHTIGHAVEAAGQYHGYHHGEAVALGMRVAAEISCRLKMLKEKDLVAINELLSKVGLPETIQRVKLSDIIRTMKHDKKFISGRNRFVLAQRIGSVKVVEGISLSTIEKAIRKYL